MWTQINSGLSFKNFCKEGWGSWQFPLCTASWWCVLGCSTHWFQFCFFLTSTSVCHYFSSFLVCTLFYFALLSVSLRWFKVFYQFFLFLMCFFCFSMSFHFFISSILSSKRCKSDCYGLYIHRGYLAASYRTEPEWYISRLQDSPIGTDTTWSGSWPANDRDYPS